MEKRKLRVSFSARLAGWFAVVVMRLLGMTLRFSLEDRANLLKANPDFPLIWAFWHNRFLGMLFVYRRFFRPLRQGGAVVSLSRDGSILAVILRHYGIRPVRGSTSRRGGEVLLESVKLLQEGVDIALTPDGPRGPRYAVQPGAIVMAQKTGASILPIHIEFSRCWKLNSWDEFRIPKPFSRVHVTLDPYWKVAQSEPIEQASDRLKRDLIEALPCAQR